MDTAKWIVRHQKLNGEFHEPGKVLHSDLQGGTNNPVTLTAYIMSSLLGFPDKQVLEFINRIHRGTSEQRQNLT